MQINKTYAHNNPTYNRILTELINNQLDYVPEDKKLYHNDIKRIAKNITSSIFDENECSLWTGYITNLNKNNKGTYINFYFRKKKVALHRLLYNNYIGPIDASEYIKFKCEHKGYCCNINCVKKHKYSNSKKTDNEQVETTNKELQKVYRSELTIYFN